MTEKKLLNASETGNGSSKRVLVGKIARLPNEIREHLNRRMRDGEAAVTILQWLNELPEVKSILAEQFGGARISHQNLSKWRRTGYQRWLQTQEPYRGIAALAEEAGAVSRAGQGSLAKGAAAMGSALIFKVLRNMTAEECTPDVMAKIAYSVTALMQTEQKGTELEHEKMGIHLRNEMVTLQWDKHQRDVVAITQHVVDDAQIKEIQAKPINNESKIELIGRRLFAELWQGRETPTT
jgi:Protein of unknown function (DUF3486)